MCWWVVNVVRGYQGVCWWVVNVISGYQDVY